MTAQAAARRPVGTSRFANWSLRKRLLMVTIALFTLLTLIVSVTSIAVMRQVLLDRLDNQLSDFGARVQVQALEALYTQSSNIAPDPRGGPGAIAVLQYEGQTQFAYYVTGDNTAEELSETQVARITSGGQDPWHAHDISMDLRGDYRVLEVPLSEDLPGMRLFVALPMSEMNQTMLALTMVIVTSAIAAGTLLVALADVTIRRAMRPLTSVVATTERISQLPLDSGDVHLSTRVSIDDPATEVGRVGESVNRMLNHIENSLEVRAASENRMRQFVADASHELRTPLAAVRGYAEITRLHERGMSDDARLSLQRIEAAANRMSALVNDLLLLARLDEGREVTFSKVDLTKLVIESVADAQAAGPTHPVGLSMPDEPVHVQGDLMRLQQVFANLLTNARVHTPDGTEIDVSIEIDDADAVVTVADSGPGISEELQSRLFGRFVRGDVSRSRQAGSSGLGLAIVKALVEAHGGTIIADNRDDRQGARFTVRLPIAAE